MMFFGKIFMTSVYSQIYFEETNISVKVVELQSNASSF